MNKERKIVVFLGPSLALSLAKKILPEAIFLPPIKYGDLLQVMKMDPTDILIIDGLYESTPSIWHKEILFAIENNIRVYGAASMGALRAAELFEYGMKGLGKIFELFKSNELEDDDEVAILHHNASKNHTALTDALVNIRATMNAAIQNNVLTATEALAFIEKAKSLHYKERILLKICASADLPEITKIRLAQFIAEGGYVDLKAMDAQLALERLKTLPEALIPTPISTPKTLYFRALKHFTTSKAFPFPMACLPAQIEREVYSRLLGETYRALVKQSMLMSLVYRIGISTGMSHSTDKLGLIKATQNLYPPAMSMNELTAIESPESKNLLALYSVIIGKANQLDLLINQKNFEAYILKFREKHQLSNTTDLNEWLTKHQISLERLTELLHGFAIIDFVAYRNNTDIFELPFDNAFEDWFLLAMRASNLYEDIGTIITNPELLRTTIGTLIESVDTKGTSYLNALDFSNQDDLDRFLQNLATSQSPQ